MFNELPRSYSRRDILKLALPAAAAAVVACSESSKSTPSEPSTLSDAQIYNSEVSRMGHEISQKEKDTWNLAYQRPQKPVPVTEQTLGNDVVNILKDTSARMENSDNKYFRHAMDVINSQTSRGLLAREIVPTILGANNPFADVDVVAYQGKVIYVLRFNGNLVLNGSNGHLVALFMTHEAQHLEENEAFINSLPQSLSAEEKVARIKAARLADATKMEANAYAVQAEALLESSRLGVDMEIPQRSFDTAVQYIKAGKDRNSQEWKNYVNNVLSK